MKEKLIELLNNSYSPYSLLELPQLLL